MFAMTDEQLPADLMEATEAAKKYGVAYTTLRFYWQTHRIRSWMRGERTRLVSEQEVKELAEKRQRIRPADED